MNDLISREVAIDALRWAPYWQDAERKIAELPAVNAVPAERCNSYMGCKSCPYAIEMPKSENKGVITWDCTQKETQERYSSRL